MCRGGGGGAALIAAPPNDFVACCDPGGARLSVFRQGPKALAFVAMTDLDELPFIDLDAALCRLAVATGLSRSPLGALGPQSPHRGRVRARLGGDVAAVSQGVQPPCHVSRTRGVRESEDSPE